jgi:hypothetical protein
MDRVPRLPRAEWAAHPRYPGQTLLLEAHEAFRKTSTWLVERLRALDVAADDQRKRLRWVNRVRGDFDWWMSGMGGHERYEEGKLYPYLARRFDAAFDHLEAGHRTLHRHADRVSAAFRVFHAGDLEEALQLEAIIDAVLAHQAVLLEHLAEEEELVIPMLLALPPEEFRYYTTTPAAVLAKAPTSS